MQDFRRLHVWRAAQTLAVFTYKATTGFPAAERFGLVSQMRRASVSVAANIAEGTGRGTRKDSKYFLQIAYGSASELLSHYLIAIELGFLGRELLDEADQQIGAVRGKLAGLMARLR
jgi:four helix bundle protein